MSEGGAESHRTPYDNDVHGHMLMTSEDRLSGGLTDGLVRLIVCLLVYLKKSH